MIEKKLHYDLLKNLREGKKIPALVYVKSNRDLAYATAYYGDVKKFPIIGAVGVELNFADAITLSMSDRIDYIASETKASTLMVGDVESMNLDKALVSARIKKINGMSRRVSISGEVSGQSLTVAKV